MRRALDHLSILQALIIRDLMGRYGRNHLGFLWTILEPMILTSGVMIVWSVIKDPTMHGISIIAFVFTGYMPLTLWRHLTNSMVRIIRNHVPLLYHRPLSVFHVILARLTLEFFSLSGALLVVYFFVTATGLVEPVRDWGLALAGWCMVGWYYGALGLIMAAATDWWEPAEKFVQPMQYLALPFSGVFFMLDWLPVYARKLILFNPSVHCFEMFRAGFLGSEFNTYYDPVYIIVWSAALSVIGYLSVNAMKDSIDYA